MKFLNVRVDVLSVENIGSWPVFIRSFIVVGVFVVMIYVGYVMILDGRIDMLKVVREKKLGATALFSEIYQEVSNLDAYKKEVVFVEEQLNKLMEQLPCSNEEAEILEDISQQAASYGLQFIAIKPGIQEDKGFYQANPFEMELTGGYNGFGEFVSKISNMKRIVTLHNLLIKKNTTKVKGALIMKVLARTYWLADKNLENDTD